VSFLGTVPPDDVSRILADHDVFAMPSRFEAFGIALVEAMAAGLPCIARRAFAMPEIVEEGQTGALVSSDDPDELALALHRVLSDSDVHARVAAARARILGDHDWGRIAGRMVRQMSAEVGLDM
jgi:glycosyltransferase involved in cell wall biosynthesis